MDAIRATIEGVLTLDLTAPAVEYQKRWVSWGELASTKAALETHLVGSGPGARVAVLMRNRPAIICAILACISQGKCLVTVNPIYPEDRVAEDLVEVDAPVVIATTEDWGRPRVLAAATAGGALCLELTGAPDAPVRVLAQPDKALSSFARAYAPAVAVEMLTSGTTGRPKRIPLYEKALEKAVLGAAQFEGGRKADDPPQLRSGVTLLTNPLAHISGLMAAVNFVLAGRRACLLDRFQVQEFIDALQRHRPKVANAPPAALRMLMDAKPDPNTFSSLIAFRTGTAPLDADLADAIYETYGVPVLQNYGATEFGGVAGWTIHDFKAHRIDKRGSVGRLNPDLEARVIDPESQKPLEAGASGILQMKGSKIGDGVNWVTTTDLAVVDADRFIWILGRADNAIVRGGFKVHPEDVTKALEAHPAVREASVVGIPDPRLGQVPVAACVLRAEAPPVGVEELMLFLRSKLAPYQVPTQVKILKELPRTVSMKVSQPDLRSLFEGNNVGELV